MADLNKVLQERLTVLSDEYKTKLNDRIDQIKKIWSHARLGYCNSDEIQKLNKIAHSLTASAATFGLFSISDATHKLEWFLAALTDQDRRLTDKHRQQVELLLQSLQSTTSDRGKINHKPKQNRWQPSRILPGVQGSERLIFIIVKDTIVTTQVSRYLQQRGFIIKSYNNTQQIKRALTETIPAIIITDMLLIGGEQSGINHPLNIKNENHAKIPIIFISPRDDIDARLHALRAGSVCYYTMPLDMNKLADKINELTTGIPKDPFRIMLIDDDQVMTDFYTLILEQEGMTVTTVNEPGKSLDMINLSRPELILLDCQMTDYSGLELSAIIRQQEKYAGISIIFLSEDIDADRQLEAINMGGDYFLTKPVDPDYLIAAINSRVHRARTLNSMNHNLLSALRELENQNFALDQHAIVSITNINGDIIYVNDKFSEISGYPRSDLIGKNHSILNSGIHADHLFSEMWKRISHGKVWQGELCNKKKNGDFYWVNITIVPFMDEQSRPYQYVAINSDITSRILAEQDLLKARDAAVSANQAKSDFLSKMSHELRTPLNAVMGFSQLLESSSKLSAPDKQLQYAKEIYKAGEHLLNLINEVLDLSRIEANQLKVENIEIPLADFLNECAALIIPLAKQKEISFINNYDDNDDITVQADPVRFKQIMINLFSNAIKYNKPTGFVEVRYSPGHDGFVLIDVIDTGTGIAEHQIGQLFKPFVRLPQHKNEEGTGIGLALSKRLAELMGGEIGVESKSGMGSKFWLKLRQATPAARQDVVEVAQMPVDNLHVMEHVPYTILYIEDNNTNLTLVKEFLTARPQITLLHATTAEHGVVLANTHLPNIILMDLHLPGMDGFNGIKALRKNEKLRDTPVIAISAYANTENIQQAIKEGFVEYITKPLNMNNFLATIDAVARQSSTLAK